MLLSMIASFLLAKRFSGKKYLSRMTIIIASISLLSVGLNSVTSDHGVGYINPKLPIPPLPLTLPVYAGYYLTVTGGQSTDNITETYGFERHYTLFFLGMTIKHYNLGSDFAVLPFEDFILAYALFTLINLTGAVLGYWLSKSTFIKRHFARSPTK